jgi:hypothetical protein
MVMCGIELPQIDSNVSNTLHILDGTDIRAKVASDERRGSATSERYVRSLSQQQTLGTHGSGEPDVGHE